MTSGSTRAAVGTQHGARRRHARPGVSRLGRRRLLGALVLLLVLSALVEIPAQPAAQAALNGLTNFEIDANQTVQGPTPPSGGAGIDWANAGSFLQDVGTPTEACVNPDPTRVDGKLNDFDFFAPNPTPGNINGKDNLCQAFIAWEPVNVTANGVTTVHYVLYGAWRRNVIPGDMSFFVPLFGGTSSKSDITLVQFDFDPSSGTNVVLRNWNGIAWLPATLPAGSFQATAEPGNAPAFGEFAIDLTAAGILPASGTCRSFVSSYVVTKPGEGNADLEDFVAVPPVQISNCSSIRITKATTPAVPDTPATFSYTLNRVDGGPVQDNTPLVAPNLDSDPSLSVLTGSLTVPTSPSDIFTNIFAASGFRLVENLPLPAPWSRQSVVCNYFNPLVLDANRKATPAIAVLTNPDGTPNTTTTFVVAPTGLLPAGVTVAADCTISNQAPSLTLAKQVVNTVGNAPATPDMWLLSATPSAGAAINYGPGTADGVTKVVAPSTYTLAETPNTAPAPPAGYTPSVWSCVDGAGTTVPVTGGNQVTLGAAANVTCTITNTAADLARLTLRKTVVGGTATVGQFTLTAQQSANNPGSIDGSAISGVTGAVAVTDRHVTRGTFSLSETGPAGYVESWLCTNGAGATVSTTNQVEIPATFTDQNQVVITCTVTNTTTALDVNVSGPSVNPAGRPHTFTLTATRVDTGAPLVGALFNLTFSNPALVTGNTCQTAPGTNAAGQCTVTVNSSVPGPFVLTVNGFTNQGPNGPQPGQPFTLPVPVTSSKLWTTYRVTGESAVNLVGDPQHVFTLHGFQNDGSGESALPAGSVIAYTWSGAGPVSPAGQCTVNASGTCDVTVTAATAGPESGTLTVQSITVSLPNGSGNTSYTLSAGDVALNAPLPALTKSWIAFRVRVEPSSQINLVGQPHTFTVTAEFAATAGVWQPVSGGTVVLSWLSAVADPGAPTTCPALSASGTCTFTVVQGTPPEPGIGTLEVTGLTAPSVTIGGQTTTITEPLGSSALDLSAATGQKTWVVVDVTITPGADNLAGEPHTFTVQVTGSDGDGPFGDGAVPGATVTSSVVSTVGGATVTGDSCTTPGTNATGQCTITVTNPGSGSIELQLEQVSFTIDGQSFVIDLTPGARGVRADAVLPIRSDKVWWQYRVILSDSSVNPLGVNHTFTALVERSRDGGTTWSPVPDGAHLDFVWTDPNTVSQVDPTSTCPPTGTGTVAGTCTFVVSSTGPTTGTLTVRGILGTFLDRNRNGQSGAPTDPIPDPTEFAAEIVNVPSSAFGAGSVLTARKTWWDFAVNVTGPAENPVGTDHTFTLTVLFSDGTPVGFRPVSSGTTMTYFWDGPAGSAEDPTRSTCDPANGPGTDASGQCTVVIASPNVPGTGTLTITGIDSTSIPQPTRDVSFTFPTPGITTKTWIAYRATISPSTTNLAGTSHPFTITVQQDRGAGFVAVPDGTTMAVVLSDPSKVTGNTCATGTIGGTCVVTVNSTDAGAVTVTPGAITVSLLDGTGVGTRVPVTVQPGSPAYATPAGATKTWVKFRLGASPSATNLAGAPHTFTVTAEFAVAPGVFQPLTNGSVDFTWTGAGSVATPPSTCPTLGAAGTCTVTVNSANFGVGILTLNGLSSATVTVGGSPTTFTDVNATTTPNAIEFTTRTATKTWVAYFVSITPSANNPVGTQHDFVITADAETPGGPVPAAGASIAFTWTGAGSLVTPSPCTTDANGMCTVSVTSPAAGTGTLTVTSLTDSAGATVDLTTPGAPGQSDDQTVPLEASKTWLQYRVLLSPNATNLTGVPHTFTATVQQTGVANPAESDWTAVPRGTTLTASTAGPGTLDPASTCLTPGTGIGGTCQFTVLDAGAGTLTLNVTAIGATTVDGVAFTNIGLSAPATATKTWVSVSVSVTPPSATNLAGNPHTFTVHVNVAGADGTATPLPADGATVAWTFTGPGTATSDTCATGTTAGTCLVTFSNSGAGSGTFTATSVTVTVNGAPLTVDLTTLGTPGQAPGQIIPVTAAKTWVAYAVTISPSANNPVGTQHDFTITATVTDGTTTSPAANASIAFTLSGTGSLVTPSPCTTSAAGTCTVSVTSPSAGTGTLQVMSLTDSAGATVDLTTPGMPGQAPAQQIPLTATKTWLQFRVLLSADATNLVGVPHTFTATVQLTGIANPTEADWAPVSDGTTLTASTPGPGTIDPTSSCLTTGTTLGLCQFTVLDAGPGTLDLTVTAVASTTINAVTFSDISLSAPATASKTWLEYTVTVSPSAANPVGVPHNFTITATVSDGATTTPAAGATIAFTWSGAGSLVTPSPCTTSASGTCTVTVTSPAAGSGTLTVTSLTDSAGRVVGLTVLGAPGQAPGQAVPLTASKTWSQYRVLLGPNATNLVGVGHTFTATVQHTEVVNPTEADWTAVPDGTTLTVDTSGTGTLDPASSCLTAGAGTSGGNCQLIVNDAGPGTLELTVTAIAATTVGGVPVTNIPLSAPATASKTWVAYTVTISPSINNPVGTQHDFTVTATATDGTTTIPAAGASIAFTWAGTGTLVTPSPCTTNANGMCTVSVTSPTAGTGTLTVTSLTDSGGRLIDLTTAGTPGQAPDQTVPLTASKTWVQFRVLLTPSATNLVGVAHTFTATVQVTGVANPSEADWGAASDGTTLTATTTGLGTLDPASTCLTTGTTFPGTCQFIVHDAGPGTLNLTVTAIASTSVNAVTFTDIALIAPAASSKTWIAVAVSVTPTSATNPLGQPHTFTVHVDVAGADGTANLQPADGATVGWTFDLASATISGDTCTTGTTAGTCMVTLNNIGAGTGTFTATSVTVSVNGQTFTVDLTTQGTPGQVPDQVVPVTASKTWLQYRVLLSPSATNLVGTPHTFTATVQQTGVATPTDADWTSVPDGTTLTATASGTGTLDATSSCLTGGTTGGTCQFVVEDNGPGALDLTVTAIASTTVNGVKFTNIALTTPSTATKTWVVANLLVHKTAGDATPVAGGDPFNYTITVTNEGPLATSAPVTVTDTLGPGLEFAGMPSMPVSAGSCVPPSGITFTCTITTSLAVGDTVTIVVPARVVAGTAGPVRNVVTIDSPEDPLCPNGTCPPPPPDCTSPSASTDNEACVLNSVTVPIPPPPTRDIPLARTGPDDLPALLGVLLLLTGFGFVVVARRRRARSPV